MHLNYILYNYTTHHLSRTERHQGFLSASVKQLNVLASFPAHSSLAVQNSHVMRAAAFTTYVQRNLSVTCNDTRGYQDGAIACREKIEVVLEQAVHCVCYFALYCKESTAFLSNLLQSLQL